MGLPGTMYAEFSHVTLIGLGVIWFGAWSHRQPLFAEGRSPRHAPELTVSESEPIDRVGKAQVSCAQVANSWFEES